MVRLLAILRRNLGNSGLQMENKFDDVAEAIEKFLAPFHIWKKFLYMKGNIIKLLKIGMCRCPVIVKTLPTGSCTNRELFSTSPQCFPSILTGVSVVRKHRLQRLLLLSKVIASFHCHSLSPHAKQICQTTGALCLLLQLHAVKFLTHGWEMHFVRFLLDEERPLTT